MAINSSGKDRIYKVWKDKSTGVIYGKLIHQGDLNFDAFHPIETLPFYETENIKKIYWTDGKNQPRLINIANDNIDKYDDKSFDFIQRLSLKEYIKVSRNDSGEGLFPAGTIQYAFSYYNKYGQQSNIFYTSPILYTSFKERGGSPEDKVSNSFNILIDKADSRFDYIRIYSIFRSSINAVPTCKVVSDIAIATDSSGSAKLISINDNGTTGYTIDPQELLFIGGEEVLLGTLAQKDNTLFCANIQLTRPNVGDLKVGDSLLKDLISKDVTFQTKELFTESIDNNSYYPYFPKSLHTKGTNDTYLSFKTFKSNEWYRFGIQFQHISGKWSEPIFLKDLKNTVLPSTTFLNNEVSVSGSKASYSLSDSSIIQQLVDNNYIKARGVVVYPEINDRSVICQGILCPTMYNVESRDANSPFAISSYYSRPIIYDSYSSDLNTTALKGAYNEFRHDKPIPSSLMRNAEMQHLYDTDLFSPYLESITSSAFISKYKENFFIDQSILTLHSPDIEFDTSVQNIDGTNLKLRVIGLANLTGFVSSLSIQTETEAAWDKSPGFFNTDVNQQNYSAYGANCLMSGPFWLDVSSKKKHVKGVWWAYPWHTNRSLNDADPGDKRPAHLKYKKMSNLRYAGFNTYLSDSWSPSTGITEVQIFNTNETQILKIETPQNSILPDIVYQGNINDILYPNLLGSKKGFPIIFNQFSSTADQDDIPSDIFTDTPTSVGDDVWGVEPVQFKYKSTPHAVFALNWLANGSQNVLPSINNKFRVAIASKKPFWASSAFSVAQDNIDITIPQDFIQGGYYIAELYRDDVNVTNRFGGQTEEAFENNKWIPCGEPNSLIDTTGNIKTTIPISFTEGDTYIQRYDNLKTQPFSQDDMNQMVEIVSFLCETHINIDGRYDRNRGLSDNRTINSTNFNLINEVYSQKNNFFSYRGINYSKFSLDKFPNTITWTKTKLAGELVDTWANINMASVLDLDGAFGQIRSLKNFNNELIGFQDTGLFAVQYNSRVQIPTSDNVPIEITNSYKVDGTRYISNKIGTRNKWSIVETSNGIYFVDDLSKSIYRFNGQIDNLSDRLGFHSWMVQNIKDVNPWSPYSYNNFTSHYDKIHDNIYFINRDFCISYSELLDSFTSFFSYEGTPFLFNIWDNFLSIRKKFDTPAEDSSFYIWDQNKGSYNRFFGSTRPYYTTVVVNQDPTMDKTFNTLEFRSDTWYRNLVGERILLPSTTFDILKVWNEYQRGEETLVDKACNPANIKQKFRVWRANIPRNGSVTDTSLRPKNPFKQANWERIRNPWIYLRLGSTGNINYETILHNMNIYYTV